MAETLNLKRLRKQVTIYTIVQLFFVALLIFMAFNFQATFSAKGMSNVFLNSIIATIILQLIIFYPLNKAAGREVEREIASLAPGLTADQQKALRRRRLYSDFIKSSIFVFFFTFILRAPPATFVLSTTFFTFVVTALTYFQCFNFAAKREIKARS